MRPLTDHLVGYLSMFLQVGVLLLLAALAAGVRASLRRPLFDAWIAGLIAYALGIGILAANALAGVDFSSQPGFASPLYAAAEYLAAFAFVVALRVTHGRRPAIPRGLVVAYVAAVLVAAVTVARGGTFLQFYNVHSTMLAAWYAAASVEALRERRTGTSGVFACVALGALAVDYGHLPALQWAGITLGPHYLGLESYLTVVIDIVLGMAAVLAATDGAQAELERRHVALEAAQAELRRNAMTDVLCGIGNRAAMAELLASAPDCGVVAMIDLDGLKRINDQRGHAAGDRALVAVAGALCARVGPAGSVFRIGGDEFAAVWCGGTEADAHERLAACARDLAGISADDGVAPVRISYGTAAFSDTQNVLEALATADGVLYAQRAQRSVGG